MATGKKVSSAPATGTASAPVAGAADVLAPTAPGIANSPNEGAATTLQPQGDAQAEQQRLADIAEADEILRNAGVVRRMQQLDEEAAAERAEADRKAAEQRAADEADRKMVGTFSGITFPAQAILRNNGRIAVAEPVSGAYLQAGGSQPVQLHDEAHASRVVDNLRALTERNFMGADALTLEVLPGAN